MFCYALLYTSIFSQLPLRKMDFKRFLLRLRICVSCVRVCSASLCYPDTSEALSWFYSCLFCLTAYRPMQQFW
jgi:hypothetical protein